MTKYDICDKVETDKFVKYYESLRIYCHSSVNLNINIRIKIKFY